MKLVWKLLRRHISIPQFIGFFFANLFGMLVVLFGFQFYNDVLPVFTSGDSFMKADYLIISKQIGTTETLSGRTHDFSESEQNELSRQPFVKRWAKFTAAEYKATASMRINNTNILNAEMFFESIPDSFVDIALNSWKYVPDSENVPVILPRSYLAMYNFGFAQTHSLPKISEGLVGMLHLDIVIRGNGHEKHFKGKVVGFSSKLNTILVPQSFMDSSNAQFAPGTHNNPTRLMIEATNPTDERITHYLSEKNYELEDNNLDAEKTAYFLKLTVSIVMGVGIIISALSFYVLLLSIYLLVQKNTSKLQNLLLIGYNSIEVSLPYQLLTVGLNVLVLLLAQVGLLFARSVYMQLLEGLFPDIPEGSQLSSLLMGLLLLILVTAINVVVIRRKIVRIGKGKDEA